MTPPTPARRSGVHPLGCVIGIIAVVGVIAVGAWATGEQDRRHKAADPLIGQTRTVGVSKTVQGSELPCAVEIWTRQAPRQAWYDSLGDAQGVRDGVPDRLKAQARRDGTLITPNAGTRLKITDRSNPTSATYEVEVLDGMYRGKAGTLQDFNDGCLVA